MGTLSARAAWFAASTRKVSDPEESAVGAQVVVVARLCAGVPRQGRRCDRDLDGADRVGLAGPDDPRRDPQALAARPGQREREHGRRTDHGDAERRGYAGAGGRDEADRDEAHAGERRESFSDAAREREVVLGRPRGDGADVGEHLDLLQGEARCVAHVAVGLEHRGGARLPRAERAHAGRRKDARRGRHLERLEPRVRARYRATSPAAQGR